MRNQVHEPKPHPAMSFGLTIGLALAALLGLGSCAVYGPDTGYTASATISSSGYRSRGTADVSLFYDQLTPYGRWLQYGAYGWCWTPYDVAVNWRPYSLGHWVYTEWGWTWVSDEPWGWAPYHYGRWLFDAELGWLWVPGEVWGPAWVAWRYDDDWVGWAPLPPRTDWRMGVGLTVSNVDLERSIEPQEWCFVRQRSLLDVSLRERIVPAPRNVTIVQRTTVVVNIGDSGGRPVQRGIDLTAFERRLGRAVPRAHVDDADTPQRATRAGNTLRMFRPQIQPPDQTPPRVTPEQVRAQKGEAEVTDQQIEQARAVERRRIETDFAARRRKMEEEQTAELARPADEQTKQQLQVRHQQEREELDRQEKIERRVVENRLQKKIVKPGKGRGRPGNDHGRGGG